MTTSGTLIFDASDAPIETINLTESEKPEQVSVEEEIDEKEKEDEELEDEDDIEDELIGSHDFAIIFKSGSNDVNIVVPDINNFEELEEEEKKSISQNHFMVGYLNYALNNEDWLNEYSFSLKNSAGDVLRKLMGVMTDMQNIDPNILSDQNIDPEFLKEFMGLMQNNEEKDADVKEENHNDIDFTSAIEQLNKNKPKIIT